MVCKNIILSLKFIYIMKWEELKPQDKVILGRMYLRGGVYSVDKMREHYNSIPDDPPNDTEEKQEDTIYRARKSLKPVTIVADHPLWDYPDYRAKRNNPNIQRHKDALYAVRRGHDQAGIRYLQTVGQIASALTYLTGLGEASIPVQMGVKGLIKSIGKEVTTHAPQYIMQAPDLTMDITDPDAVSLTLDSPGRIISKVDDAIPLGKFSFLKYLDNWVPPVGAAYDAYGAIKTVSENEEK